MKNRKQAKNLFSLSVSSDSVFCFQEKAPLVGAFSLSEIFHAGGDSAGQRGFGSGRR